jgi:acyl-CoA thioesterase-1
MKQKIEWNKRHGSTSKLPLLLIVFLVFVVACGEHRGGMPGTPPEYGVSRKAIFFFGNSLTSGYGLDNPDDCFVAIIQRKIDSVGLPFSVMNGGFAGETSSGGKARIEWVTEKPIHIFVLELGANDGLRGISLKETEQNLDSILYKVKDRYPKVELVLAGMQVPPNMGSEYAEAFKDIYPRLAKKYQAHLIPFLLENVAGEAHLNLADGIHPNVEGHKIVAENIWRVLAPLLIDYK